MHVANEDDAPPPSPSSFEGVHAMEDRSLIALTLGGMILSWIALLCSNVDPRDVSFTASVDMMAVAIITDANTRMLLLDTTR